MAIKTHKVTLSLDNPRVIQSGINVQSFDKQSIQISIELTKNDEVFQVPSDATIRVSLLKLARQEQKIIVDVPNTNRDSIDWIVPDYLDGYQGTVRVGVYLVSGAENVDLGYFTILSNVSDIDKMADEFTDNVFQGWEQIEADLNELNLTIAQTKLDLADVTSKYNAFDTSVTTANQEITDILALTDDVQQVSTQLAEKVQNFKLKNEVANGDFSNGLEGYTSLRGTLVLDELGAKYTLNTIGWDANIRLANSIGIVSDNKYYVACDVFSDVSADFVVKSGDSSYSFASNYADLGRTIGGTLVRVSAVTYLLSDSSFKLALGLRRATGFGVGNYYVVNKLCIINLTQVFGVGNEPTKLEMDELMKVIPNQWWDGELSLTQKQVVTWQLNLIRKNTNAIIALGGTIV